MRVERVVRENSSLIKLAYFNLTCGSAAGPKSSSIELIVD